MDSTAKSGNGNGIHSVEFMICSNEELVHKKNVLLTKPRALSKAIAEVLIVDFRNVEIFQLIASDAGIKVGFTVYSKNFDMNALHKHELKLAYLISDHWKVKTFTKIKDLRFLNVYDSDQQTPSTGDANEKVEMHDLKKMRTLARTNIKNADPEIVKHQSNQTNQMMYNEAGQSTIDSRLNGAEYMAQLRAKYNIAEPTDNDLKSHLLWTERICILNKLLDDRRQLLLSNDTTEETEEIVKIQPRLKEIKQLTVQISACSDDESKDALSEMWDGMRTKYGARRQKTVDTIFDIEPELLSPDTSVYADLHFRVQSTIQENLNVFELINPSKKYEIVIKSEPLGIVLAADEHGYNPKITEAETGRLRVMESKGIHCGMILSDIDGDSVLGLPFDAISKRLNASAFPKKLAFMNSENVSIRFEMVLNAASLIDAALKKGFDESNIFAFLDAERMSKLEVRTAVGLRCEYSEMLKTASDENELFAVFMDSEFATSDKLNHLHFSNAPIRGISNKLGIIMKHPTLTPTHSKTHSFSNSDDAIDDS